MVKIARVLALLVVLAAVLVSLPAYLEVRDAANRLPMPNPSATVSYAGHVITSIASPQPAIDGIPTETVVRHYYQLHGDCSSFAPVGASSSSFKSNGEVVLLVNPTGGNTATWESGDGSGTAEALVAEGYCVITYDQRGQGRSELPDGQYTIHTLAHDLAALLTQIHAPTPVHVLGWSCGAGVSQSFVLNYPAMVKSLALTGFTSAFHLDAVGWFFSRPLVVRLAGTRGYATLAAAAMKVQPHVIDASLRFFQLNNLEGYSKTSLTWDREFNVTARMSEIRVPVLHIHGAEDGATGHTIEKKQHDLDIIGTKYARPIITIPDSGHMVPIEQPKAFNNHYLDFLNSIRTSGSS